MVLGLEKHQIKAYLWMHFDFGKNVHYKIIKAYQRVNKTHKLIKSKHRFEPLFPILYR